MERKSYTSLQWEYWLAERFEGELRRALRRVEILWKSNREREVRYLDHDLAGNNRHSHVIANYFCDILSAMLSNEISKICSKSLRKTL